jgi:hypothetical protein
MLIGFPTLSKVITEEYGINEFQLQVEPRQFVAETFSVTLNNKKSFFVKVFSKEKSTQKLTETLSALDALNRAGVTNIPQPIKTVDQAYFVETANSLIHLLSYIDGIQTWTYDKKKLASFVSHLHSVKLVNNSIPVETFSSYLDTKFPEVYRSAKQPTSDPTVLKLQTFLKPFDNELMSDWEYFQKQVSICRNKSTDHFVITHGDMPGNIMMSEDDTLSVVDWDGLLFAPPERDLWFFKNSPDFMSFYGKHQLDESYFDFYLFWRLFDDLFGYIGKIISNQSTEDRLQHFNSLKEDYLEWLRPLVRQATA